MKLLCFGDVLFRPHVLKSGSLVIHPRVFAETRKWPPEKKEKYAKELAVLLKIRATSGISVEGKQKQRTEILIRSTARQLGLLIGGADIDQLSSAIVFSLGLITNDGPLAGVAVAFDVNVFSAEAVVIEAFDLHVLSKKEVQEAMDLWAKRSEKPPSPQDTAALKKHGLISKQSR